MKRPLRDRTSSRKSSTGHHDRRWSAAAPSICRSNWPYPRANASCASRKRMPSIGCINRSSSTALLAKLPQDAIIQRVKRIEGEWGAPGQHKLTMKDGEFYGGRTTVRPIRQTASGSAGYNRRYYSCAFGRRFLPDASDELTIATSAASAVWRRWWLTRSNSITR